MNDAVEIYLDVEEIEFRVRGRKPFVVKKTAKGLIGAIAVAKQYTRLRRDVLSIYITPLINQVLDLSNADYWRLNTIAGLERITKNTH